MFNEREASSVVGSSPVGCVLQVWLVWCAVARGLPLCLCTGLCVCATGLRLPLAPWIQFAPWPGEKMEHNPHAQWLVAEATGGLRLRSPLPASRVPVARAHSVRASAKPPRPAPCTAHQWLLSRQKRKAPSQAAHTHRTDAVDALPEFSRAARRPGGSPKYGNHPHPWPTSWPRRPRRQ